MRKEIVLKFFGSGAEVARRLDIDRAAVSQWPEVVPMGRAYQIQALTDGALQVDPALYEKDKAA